MLVRLGWMLAGTLVMLVSVMTIASLPAWTFSFRDGVFWGAVIATGGLRYWDTTRFAGQTASGGLTTTSDLHRYLGGLGVFAVVAWMTAQAIHV